MSKAEIEKINVLNVRSRNPDFLPSSWRSTASATGAGAGVGSRVIVMNILVHY